MIRKRAGWLCALFLGEMLTATAMRHFQAEVRVGDWWRVAARELPAGLGLGDVRG